MKTYTIDVGLDCQELRRKYGDRERFVIAKGLVKPTYRYDDKRKEVTGSIIKLSIENIHVPLKHRNVFDTILVEGKSKQDEIRLPRYEVELAYGSSLEPWILSVLHLGDKSD